MSNTQKEKKIFLAYLDDNDLKRETYVYLISKNENTVTFRTQHNIITLPYSRILKIKEDLEGENGRE